jgi:hypothetical protein
MQKIHLYGGYAGLAPFALLALAIVFGTVKGIPTDAPAAVLLAYGGMVLSFLGGIHWLPSIESGNTRQAGLALGTCAVSLVLFVLAFLVTPSLSLAGMALCFGVLYRADAVLLPASATIKGYRGFRLKLTAIAAGLLLISALALVF